MPRFNYEEADKYGSSGEGSSFFKLENDMDVARVRILGHDMNDFPGYACHEVDIDGKRKLVNCLREYGDPVDVCPLCAAKKKVVVKSFIPLYNLDTGEVQIWERGKSFFKTLSGYVARYKDVVKWITEIERHGKPKDTNTNYQLFAGYKDDKVSLDDFEVPEILGRYVLDKTAEDMEYFLDNGEFLDSEGSDDRATRRRGSREEDAPRRNDTGSSSDRSRRSRSNEEGF